MSGEYAPAYYSGAGASTAGMRQPRIKTCRLLLRRFEPADAGEVRRLADNRNVSGTTLNMPYPYGPGVAERWIGTHARNWTYRTSATWAVSIAETRTLAGAITLTWVHGSMAELGYWMGEPFWGRGYCSEAAGALIEFAFARLGIEKIVAEHTRGNPASGRVMMNAGMRHIGSARRRDRNRNPVDMDIYEIRNPGRPPRPGKTPADTQAREELAARTKS